MFPGHNSIAFLLDKRSNGLGEDLREEASSEGWSPACMAVEGRPGTWRHRGGSGFWVLEEPWPHRQPCQDVDVILL